MSLSRRSTRRVAHIIIFFFVPLLHACSLSGPTEEATEPPSSSPTPERDATAIDITPTPTEEIMTIYTFEDGEIQIPVPPPDTYSDLLEQNIEQGLWDRPEGFVYLLSYLVGEMAPDEISGFEPVAHPSPTGLMRQAQDYLASDEADPAQAAEIERLLDKIVPSQEDLDRLSQPAGQSNQPDIYAIGFQQQVEVPEECEAIEGDGFSADVDTGEHCYVFIEESHAGGRLRVYYPKWWEDEPERQVTIEATMAALLDSAGVYSGLGQFEDVNAVFSMTQPTDSATTLAYMAWFSSGEPCPVTVLPLSLGDSTDVYKQTIAHEAFHCFQDWNLSMHPYSVQKWWAEGSAEYFSNVVYPTVNDEHRWLGSYYRRSLFEPWFDMSYHNFLLFQHLGNELGNSGLISLLQATSSSGTIAGQASTLATYPNMDGMFEEFVVRTMSSGVGDSGGGPIVQQNFLVRPIVDIEDEGENEFMIEPFVAGRFAMRFEEKKRFLAEPMEEDGISHSAGKSPDRVNMGVWSRLPPEIRSGCEKKTGYALAISSVTEPGTFTARITTVEEAECDPCLLGTWDVESISYANYYEQLFASQGQSLELFIHGHLYLQFNEEGELLTRRDDFEVSTAFEQGSSLVTIIDGQGSGNYSSDGKRLTFSNMTSSTSNVSMRLDGVPIQTSTGEVMGSFGLFSDTPSGSEGGPQSHRGEYKCDLKFLTIEFPDYGDVIFLRVDDIVPTAVPTPG